jgi:hypothetical protein
MQLKTETAMTYGAGLSAAWVQPECGLGMAWIRLEYGLYRT